MTKVAIHQPNFLPWYGYFYKMHLCDIFIILDDVQFSKGSYTNRASFFSKEKAMELLTVPLQKHSLNTKINDILINHNANTHKLSKTLFQLYSRSLYKGDLFEINHILQNIKKYERLIDLNLSLINIISQKLFSDKTILLSSNFHLKSIKEDRIIDLIKAAGGTSYLSGNGARSYQNEDNFNKANLRLEYIKYPEISYGEHKRQISDGYSIYDYIACEGLKAF